MKKIVIFQLVLIFSVFFTNAQENKIYTGKVVKVSEVPIFLYALPTKNYEIVGKASTAMDIIKIAVNEQTSVSMKMEKLVVTAFTRKENGKVPEFDAIVIDVDKEKVHAIKFTEKIDLNAKIRNVKGVAIYFYSVPTDKYKAVADLPANFSRRAKNGLLNDKVKYIVKKSLEKVEKGKLDKFDAIIVNPNDFTAKAIIFIE